MARSKDVIEGEQLVKQEVITREDLDEAQKLAERTGTPWYRQLLQNKKITFAPLSDALRYEFYPKSVRESHASLGETLLEMDSITQANLKTALKDQKRNGKLLGTILLEKEFVTREDIARALSAQYDIEFADVDDCPSEQSALDSVPESVAKQKEFIPYRLEGDRLTVLISGIQSPGRLKDIGIRLDLRLRPMIIATEDIREEIEMRYMGKTGPKRMKKKKSGAAAAASKKKPAAKTASKPAAPKPKAKAKAKETKAVAKRVAEEEETEVQETARFEEIAREAEGLPVVKLVSTIIEGAFNSGATDVHLDPQDPEMRVRYRIDGVLHDVMSIPPEIENAVVSRMKILSDIDITETRHPQDGHISMTMGEAEYDIRVATLPTYLGERIVLRLLDQSAVLSGVKDLGLEAEEQKSLIKSLDQPYGMILVTGPTGSGKTTTLYSCLNQINVMTDSIVTLEDPVEYQLSGINQVQIDADIDLTFANVLRAALRQDIDVLLVGEIRDPNTARIAIRAAMTGHLVFSTLHTNDAPEAITTLRNMGIPSYLISSALTAIVAQRLVRMICPDCKTSFTPTKTLLKSVGLPESTKKLYKGKGCDECYQTGTRGRTGIFEILEITQSIRRMIAEDVSVEKITKSAKLKTMADRCRAKMKKGIITPEEFLRVIRT